jgi:ribosomal protein L11 methyltransferase
VKYPALDVHGLDSGLALAIVDDCAPVAVEDAGDAFTLFFSDTARRDQAFNLLTAAPGAVIAARDVDDENWAQRSQENLTPVAVGRVTIAPPWRAPAAKGLVVVIQPSMGFGTGHHATTRLCLAALQTLDLRTSPVLDVGTGSGVLALAARVLGSPEALGIDSDRDAVQSARENLQLNPGIDAVRFEVVDLAEGPAGSFPVVTANLTGALLCRAAWRLLELTAPAGALVVSGLLTAERPAVISAFGAADVEWAGEEDGWAGLLFRRR